jgi:hypothetical protein
MMNNRCIQWMSKKSFVFQNPLFNILRQRRIPASHNWSVEAGWRLWRNYSL